MAEAFAVATAFGEVLLANALRPAVQRHASMHGSVGVLRCIARVVNAVPLHCPAGLLPGLYPNMLACTLPTVGLLAIVSKTAGSDSHPPRQQHAAARQLLRLLPHAVTLLRIAAADAQLQPQLSQFILAMYHLVNSAFSTACPESHMGNASQAASCLEAIEAALSLLPQLDDQDVVAGMLSYSGGAAPQAGEVSSATFAAYWMRRLLLLASNSVCKALTRSGWKDRAPAVVSSGLFDALVRLHTRFARLLCWLAARCNPAALTGARSVEKWQWMQGCASELVWSISHIAACAYRRTQLADGCEQR
jgi:hypothetical protein